MTEPRIFITGTDTDVGKTYVTSAFATALRLQLPPAALITIVKPVQTGLEEGKPGDARQAFAEAKGAQIFARELRRYQKAADPYSAALAEGQVPPRADELAAELAQIEGSIVVEGSGGAACPLNDTETMADIASAARLSVVIVVGLRLGCINHALLTAEYLRSKKCWIAGAVLVDRWQRSSDDYRADVERALIRDVNVIATLDHDPSNKPVNAVPQLRRALDAYSRDDAD
jgi:dethiobiotin synthetase